jgi:hypothetical protein
MIVVAIFVAASLTCSATPLFTEDFEGATPGYYSTVGGISGTVFSLVSGSIDIVGTGYWPLLCTGTASGNCVDSVGGSSGYSGQKIETTSSYSDPSNLYWLTFSLGGWTEGDRTDLYTSAAGYSATVLVTFGSWSESFTRGYGDVPATISRSFTSTGGKLSFETTNSTLTWAGLIVDNITLESVPEPSSVVLLGGGLLALFVARRRRA